jgi:hypothetical protein
VTSHGHSGSLYQIVTIIADRQTEERRDKGIRLNGKCRQRILFSEGEESCSVLSLIKIKIIARPALLSLAIGLVLSFLQGRDRGMGRLTTGSQGTKIRSDFENAASSSCCLQI